MTEVRVYTPPGQPEHAEVDGVVYVSALAYQDLTRQFHTIKQQLEVKQRSEQSHGWYFAQIKNLWETMPESMATLPYAKSTEHLRKHALIETGFCNTDVTACDSHQIAIAAAPIIAKIARRDHGYAIVTVSGSLITCSTPMSQSYETMKKAMFEDSKNAVLDWIAHKLGVEIR